MTTSDVTSSTYPLTLPPPWRQLTVTETVHPAAGEVHYRFTAARASGTISICADLPWADTYDLIPTRVHISLGDGPQYTRDYDRVDRPVINGVPLTGGVYLDPIEFLTRDKPWLNWSRPLDPYSTTPAPTATSDYFTAIVKVLLMAWTCRPDRGELIYTRARHLAPARLNEAQRKLTSMREQAAQLAAEIRKEEQWAADLAELIRPAQAAT